MPQGNGCRAQLRRDRGKAKSNPGGKSQLKVNQSAQTVVCKVCRQSFMCVSSISLLREHQEAKHHKLTFDGCFDIKE